jgi:hypothetical protein
VQQIQAFTDSIDHKSLPKQVPQRLHVPSLNSFSKIEAKQLLSLANAGFPYLREGRSPLIFANCNVILKL